jgi:dihydropteroate synthase
MTESARWRIAPDLELDLCAPQMMGILNVTPDSFSDGGQFISVDDAVRQAEYMMGQGAAIIDVGGESTRPGAERIGVNEQVRRVVPVIESIRTRTDIPISIDTTLAAVASAALDAGAMIINDVSAGLEDDADPDYGGDVVGSVQSWLLGRADAATQAGIHPAAICLDPGLGFGKSVAQNWQLIAHTHALLEMGYPLLVAASRKSFIGAVTNAVAPADRLQGSLAVTAFQVAAGARLLRVHDVGPHVQAAKQVLAG